MTNAEIKFIQDTSEKIRQLECVIHLLKDVPRWECADFDNALIKHSVYDNKNEVLPIFENKLKELKEKLKNL